VYYVRREYFIISRTFANQPKDTVSKFKSKTKNLALVFVTVSAIVLFGTTLIIQDIMFNSANVVDDAEQINPLTFFSRILLPTINEFQSMRRRNYTDYEGMEDDIASADELAHGLQAWNPGGLIFILIAIVLILALLESILYEIFRTTEERVKLNILTYSGESKSSSGNSGGKRRLKTPLTGNMFVRLMYKRKINSYRKRKGLVFKPGYTANKLSDEVSKFGDIATLNAIYHEARYSGREINLRDISKIGKEEF